MREALRDVQIAKRYEIGLSPEMTSALGNVQAALAHAEQV